MRCSWVLLLCLLSLPATSRAQGGPPAASARSAHPQRANSVPNQTPAEYSQEPFVIESYTTTARFENDGTGEQDLAVRVRVQSDAGAQQLHELVFRYDSANEKLDARIVRVHKADGTIVN